MAGSTKGLRQIQGRIDREMRGVRGRTVEGLGDGGEFLLNVTEPDVPILKGDLRKSRFVRNNNNPESPTVEIGYSAPYAFVQHENMEFKHPIGKAKFLEDTAASSGVQDGMVARVAAKARIR